MPPKSSRDIPGPEPRTDKEREQQHAIIQDADKTNQADRNNIHGDGGSVGIKRK